MWAREGLVLVKVADAFSCGLVAVTLNHLRRCQRVERIELSADDADRRR